jgi:hypothetical protein
MISLLSHGSNSWQQSILVEIFPVRNQNWGSCFLDPKEPVIVLNKPNRHRNNIAILVPIGAHKVIFDELGGPKVLLADDVVCCNTGAFTLDVGAAITSLGRRFGLPPILFFFFGFLFFFFFFSFGWLRFTLKRQVQGGE